MNAASLKYPFLLRQKSVFFPKVIWVIALSLALLFLVFCVRQITGFIEETYLIGDYEKKISRLTQENKILELNYSKSNSLHNLGEYIKERNFVRAGTIEYIRVLEGAAVAGSR